jgi:hypothetical protein
LYHQSEFVGDCECTPQQEGDGELKDEYIDVWAEGSTVTPANHTPLMGGVQGERSTWWVGPRHLQSIPELGDNTFEDIAAIAGSAGELISQSSTIVWQDDMEVLANELGYRPDNDGGALIFVDSLDEDDRPFFAPVESVYEATGIIGRMGDTDVFTVETQGRATLRIRTPRLGRNLDPDVVLRDSYGNVVDNKGDMIFRPQENQDDWVMATAANGYSLEIPRAGIWQLLVRAHLPTDEQLDDDCNEGYLTHGNVGQYQLTVEEISNPGVIDSWITRNGNYYNEPMNIHLRFDRPMNPASFTAAQIELRNGDGAVLRVRNRELHVQPGTGNTEFYIQRGAVPLHGYSLLLRSGISDPFGNLLDQDGNPANGLAGYRTSFSDTRKPELASAQAYDGFIRLNFSEGIDASSLPASRILSLTNAGGTPLTVVGAPRPVAGTDYRSWDISIAQTPTRGFAVRLGSAVQDMWGNTIESTRRRLTVNDTVGPRVRELYVADNTTPMPGTMATQYLVVTFNERIAAASFSVSSLSTLDPDVVVRGPGGMLVPVISIGPGPGAEQQSFLVAVAPPPGLAGSYTVTIGPDIRDVYGNRMDQDADGRIGLNLRDRGRGLSIWRPEAAQDSYTSAPFRFGDMPVSAGPRDLETWFRFIMSGDVRLPQLVEPGAPPIDPLDPVIMERYFNEVLEAGRYGFTLSDELLTDLADLRIRGAIDPSRLP